MATIILRLPAVKACTGLSRSTIYLWMAEGTFPRAISLGDRSIGWIESEVQEWLDARIGQSRKAAGYNSPRLPGDHTSAHAIGRGASDEDLPTSAATDRFRVRSEGANE